MVPVALLALALIAIAWATTRSVYTAVDLVAIASGYIALAAVVHFLGPLWRRLGAGGEIAVALVPGFLVAWHFREQTRPPGVGPTLWTASALSSFLGAVLLIGGVFYLVHRWCGERDRPWRPVRAAMAILVFLIVWTGLFFVSNTTRWHLLNHNRLLGTPAYHLYATPTTRIEDALWRENRGAADYAHERRARALAEIDTEAPANIVVVMLDTMRADGLAAWGGDPALMPFLNAVGDAGYTFTDVLSNSSWTRPSVASLFTGLLPEEHGAVGWMYVLAPEHLTVAELLQGRGYETIGIVANRQAITPETGFGQGFDSYEILRRAPNPYARADEVNAEVARLLTERRARREAERSERPLFLYVHYLDPHTPYLVEGDRYLDAAPSSHARARSLYDRELQYLDRHLRRLFEMLDEELDGETALLVISDHGEEFGEHGQRGHGQSLYGEQVEVPALVRLPDGQGGRIDDRLESRDFFELILELQEPATLDVAAWAADRARRVRYASVSNSKDPGPSQWLHRLLRPYRNNILLRLGDRPGERLMWSAYGDTWELYDIAADPDELRNRARYRPDSVETLAGEIEAAPRWWRPRIGKDVTEADLEELRTLGYVR